jgi:formylglycine-generating enzyme required for sulfatase activity
MANNSLLRLRVTVADIPRLKAAIGQLSNDLGGLSLKSGDKLWFQGMVIEVLETDPPRGLTVGVRTEVKIRSSHEPVPIACAACGQAADSAALQCIRCAAELPLIVLGQAPTAPQPEVPAKPIAKHLAEPLLPPETSTAAAKPQAIPAQKGAGLWIALALVIAAMVGGGAWWFLVPGAPPSGRQVMAPKPAPKPTPLPEPEPEPVHEPFTYLKKYDSKYLSSVIPSDPKLGKAIKKLFGSSYGLFKDNFQTQVPLKALKNLMRARGFRKHHGGDSLVVLLLWFDGEFQALVVPPKSKAYYFGPQPGQGKGADIKINYLRRTWELDARKYNQELQERVRRCLPIVSLSRNSFTNTLGMKFVLLNPGSFMMGAAPNDKTARKADHPRHQVEISEPYLMQTTEVTRAQWKMMMGTEPWKHQYQARQNCPQCPATHVTWEEARTFIRRLNMREGWKRYTLPTEAQWEYAARAGGQGRYGFSDSPKDLGRYAWYKDNTYTNRLSHTQPVGGKRPNAWGLNDMLGNVDELCADYYQPGYYGFSPRRDPTGPTSGKRVVIRGGNSETSSPYLTVSRRDEVKPCTRQSRTGFRMVMKLEAGGLPDRLPRPRPVPKWLPKREQDRRLFNTVWKVSCQGWDGPADFIRLRSDGLLDSGGESGRHWKKREDMNWWVKHSQLYIGRFNEYEIYRFPLKLNRSKLEGIADSGYFHCTARLEGRVAKCLLVRVPGGAQ